MFYYTYVLSCIYRDGKRSLYEGYCSNIEKRLEEHRCKKVNTTKKFDKVELVYFEACKNKTDAIKREKQLKTGFGRGYMKKRICEYMSSRD